MTLPLSITTVANGPYQDAFGSTLLRYKYRGTDPTHRDNAGLRHFIHDREPLVDFGLRSRCLQCPRSYATLMHRHASTNCQITQHRSS